MSITISEETLRRIIREEVKKALLGVLLELIPYVDEEEQKEIDEKAGSPHDYAEEDFVKWSGV